VVDVLRQHRARQNAQRLAFGEGWGGKWATLEPVFTSTVGTPLDPDRVNRDVQRLADLAGLGRWTPHELRHSTASILLAQGVPLKVVSETLGHSSIRVTADVYGHLMEPAKAEASDAMTAALWG
jgi:integrase